MRYSRKMNPIASVTCDCCKDSIYYTKEQFDSRWKYETVSGQIMCPSCQEDTAKEWPLQLVDIREEQVDYEQLEIEDF